MEIELKYTMQPDAAARILESELVRAHMRETPETLRMHAVYYDTVDGMLQAAEAALRLRYEGPETQDAAPDCYVCCFKRRVSGADGFSRREEFEAPAPDIYQGIEALLGKGAPRELLAPCLELELVTVAEVKCVRQAATLALDGAVVELCLDQGGFPADAGVDEPFCELELELKDGSEDVLLAFGASLAQAFDLTPEERSKLVRARSVRMG